MLRRSFSSTTSTTTATSLQQTTAVSVFSSAVLFNSHRLASKSTGTNTKYQANNSKDNEIGFRVYLGQPIRKGETIALQRCRYDHRFGRRDPDYHNGKNVKIDQKLNTLTAARDGIPTVRKSEINHEYEWVDLEEDIQKVYRTQELRKHFKNYSGRKFGKLSKMNVQHNRTLYQNELKDLSDPDWRQRVVRDAPLTERFPDPNLLTRGVVGDITPRSPYYYE